MSERRETFSKAALADACPGSMVLPWTPSSSAPARGGTVLHKLVRDVAVVGRGEALDRVPDDYAEAAEDWDYSGLPTDPEAFAFEVAFALDVEAVTARELGRDLGRDYEAAGARPAELVGAADFVALVQRRGRGAAGAIVGDLKTGWAWVAPPRDNLQIRGLAAAAALSYGCDEVEGIIYHRREDSSGFTERAHFDAIDLAETLDQIRGVRARVRRARADLEAGRRPALREGPWCKHCPAFPDCPVKKELVHELLRGEDLVETVRRSLTPANAREGYFRLVAAKDLVGRLERVFKDYATEYPIDLGGGRVFGPTTSKRETLDGAVAYHAVKEIYGDKVAEAAVEWKAPKKRITDAIRPAVQAAGGKITRATLEVFELIRGRRGARVKVTPAVREYSPKAEKSAGGDDE